MSYSYTELSNPGLNTPSLNSKSASEASPLAFLLITNVYTLTSPDSDVTLISIVLLPTSSFLTPLPWTVELLTSGIAVMYTEL